MKRFAAKLAILLFIILVLTIGYNMVYQKVRYRDKALYTEDKFWDVPQGIQISNFGSSHGVYGFDYSDYEDEYTTFNFALIAQPLSYDYRLMQQYEDNFADNGVVFILVSYFSFGLDEVSYPDFESKNEKYYSFLRPEYIKQYDRKQEIKNKYFSVLFQDPVTVAKNILKAGKKGQDSYQLGGQDFDYAGDAEGAFVRHYFPDAEGNLLIRDEELEAVYGMIEICKRHNIRPILVTSPYREEYNNQFDEKFYTQFHETIDRICRDENVEYYDYSHDERFAHSYEYERNSDHLTPQGARVFTDTLIEEHVKDGV